MMPSVSVIIPCKNEENYIVACIQSVLNNQYPSDRLEVLVCDGMSEDRTPELVKGFSNPRVKLIENIDITTPYGLNAGIGASNSDIIIILGAHSVVDSEFIRHSVDAFSFGSDIGCTGGLIETVSEDSQSRSIAKAMSSPFGVGNAYFRTGLREGYVDTVAFGAYRRDVFQKVGLFDVSLTRNQDDEFNYRLIKAGYKIYLYPLIKSKYYSRSTYSKLFRQYYQYGYWKVFVNKKHRTVTTLRQLVPAAFVLYLISLILVFANSVKAGIAWFSFLVLYALLAIIYARKLARWNEVPSIVYTFFLLHLSYGLGYLHGIIRFMVLGKKPSAASKKLSR